VTADQNWSHVKVKVLNTKAESGINTIKLRYVSVKPSVMLKPGRTRAALWLRAKENNAMKNYFTV
jgi:hypothetical protein